MRKTSLLLAFILLVSFTATAEMAGPGPDAGPRPSASGGNATTSPEASEMAPPEASVMTPSSLSTQSDGHHTVRSGDTLWDISIQYKVLLEDLLTANSLAPNSVLSVGQVLLIPSTTSRTPLSGQSGTNAGATAPVRYRVQSGNTLWDIAVAYGITVEAVMKANRLNKDSILAVSQELIIPAPKRTPAASELAPQAPPIPTVAPAAIQVASVAAPSEAPAAQAVSETVSFDAPPEVVATDAQPSAPITETAPIQAAEAPVQEATPAKSASDDPAALLVFTLINEKRAGHGLAPLLWSPVLAQAAQAHAEDCARRNFGSHVGSDGARLRDRLIRAGYRPTAATENWVYSHSPQRGVEWWYNEPSGRDPHRRNILSNQYAEVGVGIVQDETGLYYIIADFGRS